jgi:hypothetical protein
MRRASKDTFILEMMPMNWVCLEYYEGARSTANVNLRSFPIAEASMLGHHYSILLLDGQGGGTDMEVPLDTTIEHISKHLGRPREGGSLQREYPWRAAELGLDV